MAQNQNKPGMGKDQFDKDQIKQPSETGSQTGTEGQTGQNETGQDNQTGTGTDTSNQPS